MKFKKVKNIPFFSKYVREDGEIFIESVVSSEPLEHGYPKNYCFKVSDKNGKVIEFMKTMKAAKEKYSK